MEVGAGCQTWPVLLSLTLQRGLLAESQAPVYWNIKRRHVLSVGGAPGGRLGMQSGSTLLPWDAQLPGRASESGDFVQDLSWVQGRAKRATPCNLITCPLLPNLGKEQSPCQILAQKPLPIGITCAPGSRKGSLRGLIHRLQNCFRMIEGTLALFFTERQNSIIAFFKK